MGGGVIGESWGYHRVTGTYMALPVTLREYGHILLRPELSCVPCRMLASFYCACLISAHLALVGFFTSHLCGRSKQI